MHKLRVGIIGLGVGEKHLAAYSSHPSCEVAWLCDFDETKLAKHRAAGTAARLTTKAADVLKDSSVNVVSIASYDNFHAQQIIQALESGKHVFIEKPLCLNESEAADILSTLKEHPDLKISSNFGLRTAPRFKWLREKLADGTFGTPYFMEGDYLWGRLEKLTKGWRGEMPYYSIILGAAVHMIDLILWLHPKDAVKQVYAVGNQLASRPGSFKFNDFAIITLEFASGLIVKITGNGGSVMPHFDRLAVYGTKGTFFQEPKSAWFYSDRDKEPEAVTAVYPGQAKGTIITSFLDSILDPKNQPLVSQNDVFSTMAVCLAADESMKTGQPVAVQAISAMSVAS